MSNPSQARSQAKSNALLWVLCLLTAFVVPLLVNRSAGPVAAQAQHPTFADLSTVAELREQIAALQEQVRTLQRPGLRAPAAPAAQRQPVQPDPKLAEQVEELTARLEQLERRSFSQSQVRSYFPFYQEVEASQDQEFNRLAADRAAQDTIFDFQSSDAEKAKAWLKLQSSKDPWPDAVVLAMAQVGATSENDRAREEVWIGAESDNRSDLLVQPLIQALLSDPSANVREEAADALSQYLHAPGVKNALQLASKQDGDSEVRAEALKALNGEE